MLEVIIFINAKYFYEKTLNAALIQIYIILTCRAQNETGNISHPKNYTKISLAINGMKVNFKRMTNKLHNNYDNMNNQ